MFRKRKGLFGRSKKVSNSPSPADGLAEEGRFDSKSQANDMASTSSQSNNTATLTSETPQEMNRHVSIDPITSSQSYSIEAGLPAADAYRATLSTSLNDLSNDSESCELHIYFFP